MTPPQCVDEFLMGDISWVVLVHVDLFEDDVALRGDVLHLERRTLDHLGEQPESHR